MSYYWFNRQEILQKTKQRYSKEKVSEYCAQNKEAIKEKSRVRYKNVVTRKKRQDQKVPKKKYQELVQYKNKVLKLFLFFFLV